MGFTQYGKQSFFWFSILRTHSWWRVQTGSPVMGIHLLSIQTLLFRVILSVIEEADAGHISRSSRSCWTKSRSCAGLIFHQSGNTTTQRQFTDNHQTGGGYYRWSYHRKSCSVALMGYSAVGMALSNKEQTVKQRWRSYTLYSKTLSSFSYQTNCIVWRGSL